MSHAAVFRRKENRSALIAKDEGWARWMMIRISFLIVIGRIVIENA